MLDKQIIWKSVKGFPYEISNTGQVRRWKRNNVIAQHQHKDGYMYIQLYRDGKRYTKAVHRLMAQTYLQYNKHYPYVVHLDMDKTNNHISNLIYVDYWGNALNKKYKANYFNDLLPSTQDELQELSRLDYLVSLYES